MSRTFVLGIDCKLYFQPQGARVTTGEATELRPQQLMDASGQVANYAQYISSYNLIKTTQDVTLSLTSSTADVTSRHSNGWRQVVSALKEGSVDMSMLWQPDDTVVFKPLMDAYISQCPMAFAVLDGPIEGYNVTCTADTTGANAVPYSPRCDACGLVTGLHADFVITSFTRNEALEEGVTADITIEPAVGMIYPEWLEVIQRIS